MTRKYVLPTKPLSITDAINRMCLATGSVHAARIGADADYNGHNIRVWFNDYRRYWIAEYFWGERIVLSRCERLGPVLMAAKTYYSQQGRGADVEVVLRDDDEHLADHIALCEANGYIPAEQEDKSWRDWKFDEINSALSMERHGFGGYTHHLIAATSLEDYKARCSAGHSTSPIAHAVAGDK